MATTTLTEENKALGYAIDEVISPMSSPPMTPPQSPPQDFGFPFHKVANEKAITPPYGASHVENLGLNLRPLDSNTTAPSTMPTLSSVTSPYAEHGPLIDPLKRKKKKPLNAGLAWPRIRRTFREPFAEFLGTFILIMFGDGVVAQVVLSKGEKGDYQSISWGWGLGVMLGVYCSGISGAHLNPAVTFANCVYRKFPWKKFPIYALAQTLGAMCAAGVVYANYKSAIDEYEGGPFRTVPGFSENATAGIFCTYPADFMSKTGQFFSEFIASTLLMFLIYALKDDGNLGAGAFTPLGLFFIIFGIGACFGWETGYAINLARDFGPRLMSYFLGYGHEVWSAGNYYFWVPMVAPFFGCTFGGFLYDLLLFTGQSPINTPYMGLYRFFPGLREEYDGKKWEPEDLKKEDSPV